ncbi:Aste57867_1277 [Aphanomyces stellatus]|uniref:Aste57867_1277 protein n=1 Tax=Aphanomyces stellatus TaxID=120398 RepID=A0A485KA90_9STRA|nr:hypothetical protein As57867_001276 [Aphanomyces stellatus]VFT78496.1 Aste57867_1277 [Aphanomyces stellatus]
MPASVWPEAAPFAVVWGCYLYMPLAIYLYATHLHHPFIAYRQPHLIVLLGCFLTTYCLVGPVIEIWNATSPALAYVLVCYLVPILAMATLLLSTMVVVLHHKITELLVAPTQFPHHVVPTLSRFRWLLQATHQRFCVAALACLFALPYVAVLAWSIDIAHLTTADLRKSPFYNVLLGIFYSEFLLASALAGLLFQQLSPIVDTFHQRQVYQRCFGYTGACILVNFLVIIPEGVLHFDSLGADYYCRNILSTVAAQCVVYFHIVAPIYHIFQTNTMTRVAAESSCINMPSNLSELHKFLHDQDNYATFLAFCLGSCSSESATEALLAWRCIETFRAARGPAPRSPIELMADGPDVAAAEYVIGMCFAPGAPLTCPTLSAHFGPLYMHRWAAWMSCGPDMVGHAPHADFFDEYHRALLSHLATDVVPRFEAQSALWSNFIHHTRSVKGLKLVQRLADARTSSVVHGPVHHHVDPAESGAMSTWAIIQSTNDAGVEQAAMRRPASLTRLVTPYAPPSEDALDQLVHDVELMKPP